MAAEEEQKIVKSHWLDDCERREHLLFMHDERLLRCPFKNNDTESCQWCRKPPYTNRYYWCDKREKYVRFRYRRMYRRYKQLPEATENSSGSETDGYEESDGDTKDYEERRKRMKVEYGGHLVRTWNRPLPGPVMITIDRGPPLTPPPDSPPASPPVYP